MTRLIDGRYAEIANTRRVGGQPEVFQAADPHQGGQLVAVKVVPATSDEIYRSYFERETAAFVVTFPLSVTATAGTGPTVMANRRGSANAVTISPGTLGGHIGRLR